MRGAWQRFVAWASRLDAPRPLPRLADLPLLPELDEALSVGVDARRTWDAMPEADRVRLTIFIRSAWSRWGRRRRAAVVARMCAGGPERVAAWMVNNGAVAAAGEGYVGA